MPILVRDVIPFLTVRAWDDDQRELTIDFVVHGDRGYAGPWAQRAQPGDCLQFRGPSGAYAPDPDAAWHLMAGDESALPAIGASLEGVSHAYWVGMEVFDGNPPEADEQFFEQLKKVTIEDVEHLKRQVFRHDDPLIVIVE